LSGIRSTGRRGHTVVPNWRWEDPTLDAYCLRVAGWLASHADAYMHDHVTRNEVARKTGVSAGKVTACLRILEQQGIITVETVQIAQSKGGKRLQITFDFDAWESPFSSVPPIEETTNPGHHMTNPGHDMTRARSPHDQTPVTTRPALEDIKEEEHRRENTRDDKSAELVLSAVDADLFAHFWNAYPRKVGKPTAQRAFKKATKRVDFQTLMAGLEAWKRYWDDPQYIPHASTWLNRDGWADEVPQKKQSAALDAIMRAARRHQ